MRYYRLTWHLYANVAPLSLEGKSNWNHWINDNKSLSETPFSNESKKQTWVLQTEGLSHASISSIRKVSIEVPVNEGTTSSSLSSLVHFSSSCYHREKYL